MLHALIFCKCQCSISIVKISIYFIETTRKAAFCCQILQIIFSQILVIAVFFASETLF